MTCKGLKLHSIYILCIIKFGATYIIPEDEATNEINSRLNNFNARLTLILRNTDALYEKELQSLQSKLSFALESYNRMDKENLLEHYTTLFEEDFNNFLRLKLDEQYLDEDIRMEQWFLKQLMPQVNAKLAMEIASLLPFYHQALISADFEEKYDIFARIEDQFSVELLALIDAQPEAAAMLNVRLIFFEEFLNYLLQDCNDAETSALLEEVHEVLNDPDERKKEHTLNRFDDLETKLGRYLSYKIYEYEIYKFAA